MRGQISLHIFALNGCFCVYILQIFFATCAVLKIGEYSRTFPRLSWGIFGHVTCLDQSRASENIWWIINVVHQFLTQYLLTSQYAYHLQRTEACLFRMHSVIWIQKCISGRAAEKDFRFCTFFVGDEKTFLFRFVRWWRVTYFPDCKISALPKHPFTMSTSLNRWLLLQRNYLLIERALSFTLALNESPNQIPGVSACLSLIGEWIDNNLQLVQSNYIEIRGGGVIWENLVL